MPKKKGSKSKGKGWEWTKLIQMIYSVRFWRHFSNFLYTFFTEKVRKKASMSQKPTGSQRSKSSNQTLLYGRRSLISQKFRVLSIAKLLARLPKPTRSSRTNSTEPSKTLMILLLFWKGQIVKKQQWLVCIYVTSSSFIRLRNKSTSCSFPTTFLYKIAALEEQLKREKAKTSQERDLLVSIEILVIFQTK